MIDQKHQEEMRKMDQDQYEQPSLYVFKYESCIRQICMKVVHHRHFENIMLIFTIISTIQLGIDNPLNDPVSRFSKAILIIDYVLTTIFAIEAIFKIIANGFVNNGFRSYMRDGTNILDFFLVLITVS